MLNISFSFTPLHLDSDSLDWYHKAAVGGMQKNKQTAQHSSYGLMVNE